MRVIKIASVLLLAIAMFMLFGTGCNTAEPAAASGVASAVPSNSQIIAAINAAWTADDNEKLAASKDKLQADLTKLQAEVAECSSSEAVRCEYYSVDASKYPAAALKYPAGWSYQGPLGDSFNTQVDCVQAASKSCDPAGRKTPLISEIDDDRSKIANFKYRVNKYVITVENANNYEGNIISYVDLRTKGTDDIERYKVTMKLQNNTLSIVSMESSPQ